MPATDNPQISIGPISNQTFEPRRERMFEETQEAVTQNSPDYRPPEHESGYVEIPDWAQAATHNDALIYYLPGYSEYPLSTAPANFFSPAFESVGYEYSPFRPLPLEPPPANNSASSPQDFESPLQSDGSGSPSPQDPVLLSTFASSSYGSPSSSYLSPEAAVSPLQPWPVKMMESPVPHGPHNHQQIAAILSPHPTEAVGSTEATRSHVIRNAVIADTAVQSTRQQASMSRQRLAPSPTVCHQPTKPRRRRNASASHLNPTHQLKTSPKSHRGSFSVLRQTDYHPDLGEPTQPEFVPNFHQTTFPPSNGAHCDSFNSALSGGLRSGPPSSVTSSVETTTRAHAPTDLRTRNRFAANKCRAKSRAAVADLAEREREIAQEREGLKIEEHQLREQVFFLKEELFKHENCGCAGIQSYLGAMAKQIVERTVQVPVDDSGETLARNARE